MATPTRVPRSTPRNSQPAAPIIGFNVVPGELMIDHLKNRRFRRGSSLDQELERCLVVGDWIIDAIDKAGKGDDILECQLQIVNKRTGSAYVFNPPTDANRDAELASQQAAAAASDPEPDRDRSEPGLTIDPGQVRSGGLSIVPRSDSEAEA